MNWKNTAENLIIVIFIMIATAFVTYKVTLNTAINVSLSTANSFLPTIKKAIDKESIKNEITNDISLKIDKIKKSDSLQINVKQIPENNQKPKNILSVEKKKGCGEGQICIDVKNLTRRQKRRLQKKPLIKSDKAKGKGV